MKSLPSDMMSCACSPALVSISPVAMAVSKRPDIAHQLAHFTYALDVYGKVRVADLQLDAADTAFTRNFNVLQHLIERRMEEAARGVVALDRIAMRAQQLGQGQARPLGFHIPKRNIERRNRLCREPAATHRCAGPQQLREDLRDVAGIFAQKDFGEDCRGARPQATARFTSCGGPLRYCSISAARRASAASIAASLM